MDKLNITAMLNPHASYKDMSGKAELAWHIDELSALEIVGKKAKINTNLYEVIGISLFMSLNGFGMSLYIADRKRLANGKQKVKSVGVDLERKDFLAMVKDLSIKLFDPHINHDESYEYYGEDSLENFSLNS